MKFIEVALKMKHGDVFKTPNGMQDILAFDRKGSVGMWFLWDVTGNDIPLSMKILETKGEIKKDESVFLSKTHVSIKTDSDDDQL